MLSGPKTDTSRRTTGRTACGRKVLGLLALPPTPPVPTTYAAECCCGGAPAGPRGGTGRRDGTVAAAASRTGPVEAARAYASQGNDARQAAAALDPTAAASGKAKLEGHPPVPHVSRPRTYRAGKGKVWLLR